MQLPIGPELEPEMERLLARLVPNYASQVEGASLREIEAIEAIAGRPLPGYYRWFLWRMGRSMGPFAYRSLDFSIARILDCYDKGTFKRDPRFLMIGYETDSIYPAHMAYDFDHPARDDARVTVYMDGKPRLKDQSHETLREMHAYAALLGTHVSSQPQRVSAVLYDEQKQSVAQQLSLVMAKLGFASPIKTGAYCVLYEREDAALIGSTTLARDVPASLGIRLGARHQLEIRSILGAIVSETGVEFDLDEWDPPLP